MMNVQELQIEQLWRVSESMNEFLEATNISTCDCTVEDYFQITTKCLICGEDIIVSAFDPHIAVCEKCKKAVLYMRAQLEDIKWN